MTASLAGVSVFFLVRGLVLASALAYRLAQNELDLSIDAPEILLRPGFDLLPEIVVDTEQELFPVRHVYGCKVSFKVFQELGSQRSLKDLSGMPVHDSFDQKHGCNETLAIERTRIYNGMDFGFTTEHYEQVADHRGFALVV